MILPSLSSVEVPTKMAPDVLMERSRGTWSTRTNGKPTLTWSLPDKVPLLLSWTTPFTSLADREPTLRPWTPSNTLLILLIQVSANGRSSKSMRRNSTQDGSLASVYLTRTRSPSLVAWVTLMTNTACWETLSSSTRRLKIVAPLSRTSLDSFSSRAWATTARYLVTKSSLSSRTTWMTILFRPSSSSGVKAIRDSRKSRSSEYPNDRRQRFRIKKQM